MCFIVLYCPVLHCSTLPPGLNPFVLNNNNNNMSVTEVKRSCQLRKGISYAGRSCAQLSSSPRVRMELY